MRRGDIHVIDLEPEEIARIPGMMPPTVAELVRFLSELTEEMPDGGDAPAA